MVAEFNKIRPQYTYNAQKSVDVSSTMPIMSFLPHYPATITILPHLRAKRNSLVTTIVLQRAPMG